jgi:hypothetical protein
MLEEVTREVRENQKNESHNNWKKSGWLYAKT